MKRIQNIIIGFFAVMGLIISTTSLSSKSESIYVPHKDGVLNTQTGMIYLYSAYLENKYTDDERYVYILEEIDIINKSIKKDTLQSYNIYRGDEFFISK